MKLHVLTLGFLVTVCACLFLDHMICETCWGSFWLVPQLLFPKGSLGIFKAHPFSSETILFENILFKG